MNKKQVLLIIVFAALIFIIVYLWLPPVKAVTDKNVLSPLAGAANAAKQAIYASPIWQTYFAPAQYAFLWGVGFMAVFAIVWWKVLSPKMPTIHKPTLKTSTPTVSTSTITASTPVGATVRPEATTPSTSPETPTEETEQT